MADTAIVIAVEDDDAKSARKQYEEDFLTTARERFKQVAEAESEIRQLFLEDVKFFDGEQWPAEIRQAREKPGSMRPCLTLNRLPQIIHSVSNEIRQNKPAAKVSPVDDSGDPKTAEVMQGIIRYIERLSNAPAVRSYASLYSIITGRSYYRIITDYTPGSRFWDQDIYIRRILNPMTVYMDPECREPDCSDARYCFIVHDMSEERFRAEYPDAEVSSAEEFRSTGDGSPLWQSGSDVRVVEYFSVDTVPDPGSPKPRRVVTWSKITAAEILMQQEWPGYCIPVVRVVGEEYDVDGKRKYVGMVRNAKDAQRMINYWESAKTEMIALAPKAPFLVAEGQIENHEQEWANANTATYAYLQYRAKEVGGTLVPAPSRQSFEPPIQAISVAQGGAVDNLKATTGVYDPSLGNRSNETSGIAIRQRLMQGSTANYHYIDNLQTAITYEAKCLIDLIPKIYDRPGRVLRIIGEDDTQEDVTLNQRHMDKSGIERWYQLDAGRYDVAVDIGPSYQTKRQESAESMQAFAQAAPQLLPQYADLFVQAMDWPMADEIAKRVRPPGVGDDEQIPPQAAMQLQQMQQALQEKDQMIQQMQQIIMGKQVESQSREKIAQMDNQTRFAIAQLQAQSGMATKQADLSSNEELKYADISSKEMISDEDNETKRQIALLNAQVKGTGDQLKFTSDQVKAGVALENGARKQQPGNRNQ